jgi:hypothetical protein
MTSRWRRAWSWARVLLLAIAVAYVAALGPLVRWAPLGVVCHAYMPLVWAYEEGVPGVVPALDWYLDRGLADDCSCDRARCRV